MNNLNNKIIEKDCVIIDTRLKKRQNSKTSLASPTEFLFYREILRICLTTQFSNYLLLNILFYTGYTHHFLMPNADTIKSSRILSMVALKPATWLALVFLPTLYWHFKNIPQERNTNRKGLKKKDFLIWLARWLAQKYMLVLQSGKTNFDCKENPVAW